MMAKTSLRELRLKPRNSILGELRLAMALPTAAGRGRAALELPIPLRAAVLPSEIACDPGKGKPAISGTSESIKGRLSYTASPGKFGGMVALM